MSSYNYFANLYDVLTQDVDYEVRSNYISDFLSSQNIKSGTVLDLACGTCSMSIPLCEKGYSVIGVDSSSQMLTMAQNKINEDLHHISLINSKMQYFALSKPVDACICCLDSINHLDNIQQVKQTFLNVFNSLKNDGVFIFDVNTIYKHQNILSDNTFVFDEKDYYLVWDNELLEDNTVRILLDFFVFNGNNYDRYSEEFNEKAYTMDELINTLNEVGFETINIYDDLTQNKPNSKSERVYFVCKKENNNG